MLLVEKIMTRNVVTCSTSETLNRAAQIMWENDCGAVPVVDEHGRVAGLVTDRDICMAAYTNGSPLSEMPVVMAWSRRPISCQPSDDIAVAAERMCRFQVRRLVVTDHEGRLLGLVSVGDLARLTGEETSHLAPVMAAVSKPRKPLAQPFALGGDGMGAHRLPARAVRMPAAAATSK